MQEHFFRRNTQSVAGYVKYGRSNRMDGNSLSMHTTFLMVLSPPVNHCNVAWWQHFISVYHVKQKVVVHLLWGGGGDAN